MGCAPPVSTMTSSGSDSEIDADGKTLYWMMPGNKKILITTTRGGVRFLTLSTLASRYRVGGTDALRRSLGLTGYTRNGLSSSAVKVLQQADKSLPSNLDNIEPEDLPGIADSACQSAEQVEIILTTIDDQPIDTLWVTQARRELAGLEKAMTGVTDELANNLAKLRSIDDRKSEVKRHLAREHRKLRETDDTEMQREIWDRIRQLESVLSDIELERQARLEALSMNRATLRPQRDIQTDPPWRHHTGWAHSHPVLWARNYHRIDSHSHRHGDLNHCACAHRGWGKCAGAGSQATWQERFERVGEKTPAGPQACPGKLGWQGCCGPARYHWLNCLLAPGHIGKDWDLARRKSVGISHCCGDPASQDWLARQ